MLVPMLTGFFSTEFVMAVTVGAVCPLLALVTATLVVPPALHHPTGMRAMPSAVLPTTRAVARPVMSWTPAASGAGALAAVSDEWKAAECLTSHALWSPFLREPAVPPRSHGRENKLAAAVIMACPGWLRLSAQLPGRRACLRARAWASSQMPGGGWRIARNRTRRPGTCRRRIPVYLMVTRRRNAGCFTFVRGAVPEEALQCVRRHVDEGETPSGPGEVGVP